VDALFTGLYERHGRRYIVGHLAGVYLLVALIGVLGGVLGSRLAGFSVAKAVWVTGLTELSLVLAIGWATWAVRDDIRAMMRWAARASSHDELARAEVISSVFRFSPRFAAACVWRVGLITLPAGVALIGVGSRHSGLVFDLTIAFYSAMIILYGGVAGAFLGQLSLRPLRREVGRSLNREGFAPLRSLSVATKVRLGFVAALLVISCVIVVATFPVGHTPTVERAIWESVLIVATFGLAVALPVTQNALDPVRDLIEGTHQVASGDLSAEVPVTSTDELGELAASFNEMIGGLRERESLREELQASRARIVAAADAARRRVERDLHDGAQQRLVLIGLKLGLARRQLDSDPPAVAKLLDELRGDLDVALSDLRDLAHGIYPAVLENEGLPGALRDAAELAAIPTKVECDGVGRHRPELEAAIYFCCLEALQNAVKHAGEQARVELRLREGGHELRFEVADDGVGFDPAGAAGGSGLQNMSDRIGALGGEVSIQSAPGAGTTIAGSVPVERVDTQHAAE
jgi:signal transduction histidine kinase